MKNYLIVISTAFYLFLTSCKSDVYDICIYGGTSSGVIAANAAKRLGKTVIIIEPSNHLGGLSSGGLGSTDIGNKFAVTGIALDFYRRIGKHYNELEQWRFEPHVAEKIFQDYVDEEQIEVVKNYRLLNLKKEGEWIKEITIENSLDPKDSTNRVIKAKMFIDCSYEGDLMAKAGVKYTVGREANKLYNETYNGVQFLNEHQFEDGIDPYKIKGDSTSGLAWGVSKYRLQPNGTGDEKIQAYNFRICLTNKPENRISISKPIGYDPEHYVLLKRIIEKRIQERKKLSVKDYMIINMMPNDKTDINNKGGFSTDMIGENWNFPEADYKTRDKIAKKHENYIKGFFYFLGNDESVPDTLRKQMKAWGWCKDEFLDNGGFPHQLYVREARRMIGEYVMTQHNCQGKEVVEDGIGMAAYTMDSHNCQRIVWRGMVKNEGDVQVGGFRPYPIAYRSIVPKATECKNLIVPVCMSATHIAYGSIRMEPVFMVLGQSAALAASMAIDDDKAVQEIDIKSMIEKLNNDPMFDGKTKEIIIDNSDKNVSTTGIWDTITPKKIWMDQYKFDCFVNKDTVKAEKRIKFSAEIQEDGWYGLYYYCPTIDNKRILKTDLTSSLPIKIHMGETVKDTVININDSQKKWLYIGKYEFAKEKTASIEIVADSVKSGLVAVDAVLFKPLE